MTDILGLLLTLGILWLIFFVIVPAAASGNLLAIVVLAVVLLPVTFWVFIQ